MAVSKVVVNTENGSETLIDLTSDTITDDAVFQGITFHSADGGVKTGKFTIEEEITEQDSLIAQIKAALHGKAAGGGGSEPVIQPIEITENGTYIAPDGTDGYSPITVQVESGGGDAIGILDGTATEINNSQVTSIGAHCCRNRDALIKVNLPNVTTLGASAFYQCPNLSEVHIPNLTTLSSTNIFNGTAVTEINFPKLTTATIPGNTFTGCAQLRKADLGSKVKGISANAFNGQRSITRLTDVPRTIRSLSPRRLLTMTL